MFLLLLGLLRALGGHPNLSAEATASPGTGSSAVGPGSPGPTAAADPTAPVPPATTTAARVPAGTRPATAAGRGPRIVTWIRDLGLTGGGGSYQEAFFAELSWGQCAELLRDVNSAPRDEVDRPTLTLYRAAAQACLAAFHGKRSLWPAADAAVEELSGRSADLGCIDRSAYDLTRTLVKIHRSAPYAVLQRGHTDDADGPCPRVRSVEPGSGPAGGGYQVRITGDKLPNPAVIHFGAVTRTVPTSGGRTAVVTVPPAGRDYDVAVWVDGWPFGDQHSPLFSYERPASSPTAAAEKSHGP